MNSVNRRWVYSSAIRGALDESNFTRDDVAVPTLTQGQALIRNRLISLDPANRVYFAMQTYRPQLNVGGSTQFAITWLIKVTGNPLAPAWYMAAATTAGLIAMAFMHETAPVKTGGRGRA